MKAVIIETAGPPESFQLASLPVPTLGESEVLIRQRFAAVNYGDVIRRKRGLFPASLAPPYILGFEGVGTVTDVGRSVRHVQVGERVSYLAERGGYAEYIAIPVAQLWHVPDSVNDEAAAGISCVGLTAWGLSHQSGLRPGDTAVIHGAAGGVGSILVQILAAQGVRTIALVNGMEKQSFVSRLGADLVLDRQNTDIEVAIKRLVPNGVDCIFDCVGQDVLNINLAVIRPGGVWMYFGSTSGHATFPGDRILMNRISLQGFVVFEFARKISIWEQGTAFLSAALAKGHLKAQTTEILPLSEVSQAHRQLEARSTMGKILLRID